MTTPLPTPHNPLPTPHNLQVGVLGLGHVGLPTALTLAELGWQVVGTDHDRVKVERIASGKAPFYETGLEELLRNHLGGRLRVTPQVEEAVREATVLFICVGTPQNPDGSADLSQVEAVGRVIAQNLNGYKLIVEKSTVPLLTAERIKRTILRYCSSHTGNSGSVFLTEQEPTTNPQHPVFDVAVNPEFLREGTALHDCLHPDRVVLGVESEWARDLLLRLYEPLVHRGLSRERILVTNTQTAELIKHAANAFLAMKVSFINMVADLCESTGADVMEVARGIGLDPRIGPDFLRAGIGYGGTCLPKDLRAFIHVAREHKVDTGLLEAVERVNEARVDRFLAKVKGALWVLKEKRLAVWGLAFKPGTDDVREAPSRKVVARLREEGALLRLYDPRAQDEFRRQFPPDAGLVYCSSALEAAEGAEALLLLTEWPEFREVDFEEVRRRMVLPLVFDGRNFLDRDALRALGFEYYGMGR